jgi:hypothetical protein
MYTFDTKAAAEQASNEMFKLKNPEGTTELLYGYIIENGKYVLQGVDERFVLVDDKWTWQEPQQDQPQE